jgi:large subunit ribosomal protein L19
MNLLQEVQKLAISKKKVPDVKIGNTVKVHQKIKEGEKERIQIFEGLVIAINSGHGADKTITVRKVVEGIGVEKIFPLYSQNIEKIEVKKQSKVRRSKLYYMRGRMGKSARLKETFVKENLEFEKSVEELAIQKAKEEAEKAANEGVTPETVTTEEAKQE